MIKMQISLLTLGLFGAFISGAHADGFQCESVDGRINAKVFNETNPRAGTRNAAIMVLSDATETFGERTIATFEPEAGVLKNYGAIYVVDVANSETETGTLRAPILDMTIGDLASIEVNVAFSYGAPVAFGTRVDGKLILTARDGKLTELKLVCTRYLKHR